MVSNAFTALSLAHGRELVRDRKTAFASIVMPVFFLALFMAVGYFVNRTSDDDAIQFLLPTAMFFMLGSMAFFGTVSPMVELRQRRTLRLLSTTPLTRRTVLFTLAPARLGIAFGYIGLILAVSAFRGYLSPAQAPLLVVSSLAGLTLFLSLGFVLAAVLPTAESANNTLSLVLVVLAFLGGALLPLTTIPEPLRSVLTWLPPARLIDAFQHHIAGLPATHPLWASWLVLFGAAAACTALAIRVFTWDTTAR